MDKVLYIYNIEQCSFYMRNGVQPIDGGIHPTTKRVWLKFKKEDTFQVYEKWLGECKKRK